MVGRTGQSLLICALGWNRSYLIALVRPITRRARKGGCNWLKQGLAGRIRQLRLKENDAAVARFVRGPETLFEEIGGQAVLCNTTLPPTGLLARGRLHIQVRRLASCNEHICSVLPEQMSEPTDVS